jgi:hypothetical protein
MWNNNYLIVEILLRKPHDPSKAVVKGEDANNDDNDTMMGNLFG